MSFAGNMGRSDQMAIVRSVARPEQLQHNLHKFFGQTRSDHRREQETV